MADTTDYNASTALRAFFTSRTSRQMARHIAAEATLHDLAEIGVLEFFEGSGSDPTGLPGYAADKVWLRQYANAQDAAGDFLVWNGTGSAADVTKWVPATPQWFRDLSAREPTIDINAASVALYYPDDKDDNFLYTDFPKETDDDYSEAVALTSYANVVIGVGPTPFATMRRTTVVGAYALTKLEEGHRLDVFGQGALRNARYAQRSTVVGTLAMQWLGQQVSELRNQHHDFWYPTAMTDPAWNPWGLETANPGIRAKLLAVTQATSSLEARGFVAIGRDALCETIKGQHGTAVGYKAAQLAYYVDGITAVGNRALSNNVLANFTTACGEYAGFGHQEGDFSSYFGRYAGYWHVTGQRSTFIGVSSGEEWTSGNDVLLIGPRAGRGVTPASNFFAIHNGSLKPGEPLISGDFENETLNLAGLTVTPTQITAPVPVAVPEDAYAAGWNGSTNAPTKNAIFDVLAQFQTSHTASLLVEFPDNKTYVLQLKAAFGGTVTETTTKCSSGTATATFRINGAALGGTANAVSSTEQSRTHTTANVFVAGDDIEMVISANASCLDLVATVQFTRALS